MHGIREQEDEDDEENDIESQCKRILSLHCLDMIIDLFGVYIISDSWRVLE